MTKMLGPAQGVSVATNAKVTNLARIEQSDAIAIACSAFGTDFITTTALVYVQVCATSDGTYQRVKVATPTTAVDWNVESSTGDFIAICDATAGWPFCKLEFSNTATDGYTASVYTIQ